jgi:hypothetical protein
MIFMLFNFNGESDKELELTTESAQLINEMILIEGLTDEELEEFLGNSEDVNTAIGENLLTERTIVRLDKKAKLSKAIKSAEFAIAKEKSDRDFKKLVTIWKMERFLEAKIHKKYYNEAVRRAKKQQQEAAKSRSNIVQKASAKTKSMFNSK